MRRLVVVAGGMLLVLAAVSPGLAAKLKGKPFLIDPETAPDYTLASAFATGGGAFAVSFTEAIAPARPGAVWLRRFNAKGKPLGERALVARGKPGTNNQVYVRPKGGLTLKSGDALVSFQDQRVAASGAESGLFGQIMSKDAPVGGVVEIDDADRLIVTDGRLTALGKGGVATWGVFNRPTLSTTHFGRIVSPTGELAEKSFDLSRPGADLEGVYPYRNGFIAHWLGLGRSETAPTAFVRTYDRFGAPTGEEAAISGKKATIMEAATMIPTGLSDGNIVAVNATEEDGKGWLEAQLFDKSWKKLGKSKVLMKALRSDEYVVQPLPGGDFILAIKVKDGAEETAIAVRRFNQKLKPVGPTARIATNGADPIQLLTLDNGDVLLLYVTFAEQLSGQLIKP